MQEGQKFLSMMRECLKNLYDFRKKLEIIKREYHMSCTYTVYIKVRIHNEPVLSNLYLLLRSLSNVHVDMHQI